MSNHTISVCMATYNGEQYIEEQLDSIISCLNREDELVISDDGSKDGTIQIIEKYKERFPNIKFLKGPQLGVIKNFENAITHAKGDIIFLSDQDDIWERNKVEVVRKAFLYNPNTKVILHNALIVNGKGETTGLTFFDFRKSARGLLRNLYKNSYIGCCMAFLSPFREAFLPFPDNIEMHDWWIGLVAERESASLLIEDCLIRYRRHDKNVSAMAHHPIPKMIKNRIILTKALLKRWKSDK